MDTKMVTKRLTPKISLFMGLLAGCNGETSTTKSLAAPLTIDSSQIWDKVTAAMRDPATISTAKSVRIVDFLREVEALMVPGPLYIDGIRVDGLQPRLSEVIAGLAESEQSNMTIGDALVPRFNSSSLTFAAFKANLRSAGDGKKDHLALVSDSDEIPGKYIRLGSDYVPVRDNYCDPLHKMVSPWWEVGDISNLAAAVGIAKSSGTTPSSVKFGSTASQKAVAPFLAADAVVLTLGLAAPLVPAYAYLHSTKRTVTLGKNGIPLDYFDRCFGPPAY